MVGECVLIMCIHSTTKGMVCMDCAKYAIKAEVEELLEKLEKQNDRCKDTTK